MRASRQPTKDLLWSVVFLLLGLLAGWTGKGWWFTVFLLLAFGLVMQGLRQDAGEGEA